MAYRISTDEVRFALRTMVEAEISDSLLLSTSFIPTSEAWLDQILSNNSLTYSGLSSTKQVLAKSAQISRCAWTVLNAAPKEAFKAGLTDFKGVSPESTKLALDTFAKDARKLLGEAGISTLNTGGFL